MDDLKELQSFNYDPESSALSEALTPQGYSFDTQMVDSVLDNSIAVSELRLSAMMREKTEQEYQAIRELFAESMRAEQRSRMDFWDKFSSGWRAGSIAEEIGKTSLAIAEARSMGAEETESVLLEKLAKQKWEQEQNVTPIRTDRWSAYNFGQGIQSTISSLPEVLLAEAVGTVVINTAAGLLTIGSGGAAAPLTAAAVSLGRKAVKAKRLTKAAVGAVKAGYLWGEFSKREAGSLYSDLLDNPDLTEEQRLGYAMRYGALAGAIETAGAFLGAEGLIARGTTAVGGVIGRKLSDPVARWTADAALKNAVRTQIKKEAAQTATGRIISAGKTATKNVAKSVVSEVGEEGSQQAMELSTVQQVLNNEDPNVWKIAFEGFRKLANVPVEMVQGKLSDESIKILDAMGAAMLPSLAMGAGGALLTTAVSSIADSSPADTGVTSNFRMKNASLQSSIMTAEKNLERLNAISNYMASSENSVQYRRKFIQDMVDAGEIEQNVYFSPEDTEVLVALSESSPTLQNTMARLGITKAIAEGQKTGTVAVPMADFAELVAQEELKGTDQGKQLNISGTVSLGDTSYSRIERSVRAASKKGKELMAKPSAKLERKLKGLRRQFESAGFTPEETEANLAMFTSSLAAVAGASNGAVTVDELIDDFHFNIEKRNYDLNDKNVEKVIGKIRGDTRPTLGAFRRFIGRARKPLPADISKMDIESVAAQMKAIDAKEKPYTGETITINGKQRSVYNSHGVRIAQSAKALRAFYKWFGDSKVVDELGRPKVLYHGTPRASFVSFLAKDGRQRFFFTDDISIAATYAGSSHIVTREEAEGAAAGDIDPNAGIYQVYLKIENPTEVDYNGKPWTGDEHIALNIQLEDGSLALDSDGQPVLIDSAEKAHDFFKSGDHQGASLVPADGIVATTDDEAMKAKSKGSDGAILKNVLDIGDYATKKESEYPTSTVYVTFEPQQIKSTDNYGMFDPRAVEMYRSLNRTVYAGSPTNYPYPSLRTIGTGEGHFAHGWGLYYALTYGIAAGYKGSYDREYIFSIGGESLLTTFSMPDREAKRDISYALLDFEELEDARIEVYHNQVSLKTIGQKLFDLRLEAKKSASAKEGFHRSLETIEEDILSLEVERKHAKAEIEKQKERANAWLKEHNKEVVERIKNKAKELLSEYEYEYSSIATSLNEVKKGNTDGLPPLYRLTKDLERVKANIRFTKKIIAKLNSSKGVDISFDVNTGQLKEFTARKIDTFMREDLALDSQHKYIRNALIRMFKNEPSLKPVLSALRIARIPYEEADKLAHQKADELYNKYKSKIDSIGGKTELWSLKSDIGIMYKFGDTIESRMAWRREQLEDWRKRGDPNMVAYEAKRLKILSIVKKDLEKDFKVEDIVNGSTTEARYLYNYMVNHMLGKEPTDHGGKYKKKMVHEAKRRASMMLLKYGISGIRYEGRSDGECLVVFDAKLIKPKYDYFSRRRGSEFEVEEIPESDYDIFSEVTGMRGPKEIYIAKHAETTTFMHEVMHFVTRSMIEMYNDGTITEPWRKEVERLYDQFSTMPSRHGPAAMHKDSQGKITMELEASETLSSGFQLYVERGKASNTALEKLYAYVTHLAAELRKLLTNSGYFKRDNPLSDTQVRFYDKVMESYTEVQNTEYKFGYAPLEKLEGVSDDEYEAYLIERKVGRSKSSNAMFKAQRKMVKDRKREEWIKYYDEEFKKAYAELGDQPEYIVMQYILKNGKLNRASFKKGTRLALAVPERYFAKKDDEGLTVEELSAKFGPEISIADIAKILTNNPSLEVAARRRARTEADRRFLEEHNPSADVTPANAMRTMLFVRSLLKESFMIKGEPLSSFPAHYSFWIKEAEAYVMGLTVKNATNLEKWADMESRVTDDFMSAFTGGDTQLAAMKADQRAMVNYVLVRSKQIRKMEAQFKRRFKKFYSAPQAKDIKTMDGVTWNLIHSILQAYGFTRRSGRLSASAKEQFKNWLEVRKGKQYFPYEALVEEMDLLSNPPKRSSLTVETFSRLFALLNAIKEIGEAEMIVFNGNRRDRLDVVAGQIIENIQKLRQAKGDKAFAAYGIGSWSRLTVPQLGMLEPLFGEMGMRHLFVQLRNAIVARDNLADTTRAFIADSFIKNKIGDLLADKSEFIINNRTVNNNILLFALQHSGNEHNRANAIATLQQYFKDDSFSEADYIELLNASPKAMRNYVNDLWSMFKNMKNLIDDQTRVATGELIATVEPTAYTLDDGTQMTGGYFPAPKMNKVNVADPFDNNMDNNLFFPKAGLVKDRVKNETGHLDLSQDALSRWIFQAVNLATMQVAFNDIKHVIETKEVQEALGPDAGRVTRYVTDWVRAAIAPVTPQPKALRMLAKGPTVVFLGFKAVSGLVQLLGSLIGLNEVSFGSLAASAGKLLNIPKYFKISEEMAKRSAFMGDRAKKFDSRFFGLMKDQNMLEKAGRKYGEPLTATAMSFVRTFQCMADMVVWDGAYADAKKGGMTDKEASDHADYIVMKTQGDRVQMNTPEGFQGVLRFFQPFMTYILTLTQMGNAATRARNYKKLGTLIALIVVANMFEAYFKEKDKDWRRELLGKKTKGTDYDFDKRWRNRFLVQTVSTLGDVAIPFAGVGSALSLAATEDMLKAVSPGYRAYDAGGTPAVEVAQKAVKAVTLDKNVWEDIYDEDMSLGANLIDFLI